jgi:hypothetical protein
MPDKFNLSNKLLRSEKALREKDQDAHVHGIDAYRINQSYVKEDRRGDLYSPSGRSS